MVAPGGKVVGGPMRSETGVLSAEVNLDLLRTAKRKFDVAGHYSRPDVFSLSVEQTSKRSVQFC